MRFLEWVINLFGKKTVKLDLSSILFTTCNELTLAAFEQCYVDKDLLALVKNYEGFLASNITWDDLAERWERLQTEYCDLSSDENFRSYLNKRSKELAIFIKKTHVPFLISQLATAYDENYVQALRDYGYREKKYPLDITNPEIYIRSLNAIHMSLAQDDMRLQEIQRELQIHTDRHKGAGITEGYFDSALVEIEKHIGFSLNKETLTVRKYCNYLNNLREHNKPKMKENGR